MAKVNLVERYRYRPTEWQKRKAKRGYLKGTGMTIKKPGDLVLDESGVVLEVTASGGYVPRESRG